jgi:predicted NUDIX family NTP pyrophosphohydrolase
VKKQSAGILVYRFGKNNVPEFFLVHPGGPYWVNKDDGAWSIPKGEFEEEDPLICAVREFREETGQEISGNFVPLTPLKQKSGKLIHAWAVEGEADHAKIKSNLFELEWPPKSGKQVKFPEVDRAGWFTATHAKRKLIPGQVGFIEEVEKMLE